MQVHVRVYATLTQRMAHNPALQNLGAIRSGASFMVALAEGDTIANLVAKLDLPPEEIKIAFVNARAHPLGHALQDGDEVGLFPPIGGG